VISFRIFFHSFWRSLVKSDSINPEELCRVLRSYSCSSPRILRALRTVPVPCKIREIAFVESFIGTWKDNTYDRQLIPHLSVCSDSTLIRVKNGKESAKDRLVLRDLFGGKPITFRCSDLLSCARSIELADITARIQKRLKGETPFDSWRDFKKSQRRQTSTISSSGVYIRPDKQSGNAWFGVAVVEADKPLSAKSVSSDWKQQGPLARPEGDFILSFCPEDETETQYCHTVSHRSRSLSSGALTGSAAPASADTKRGVLPFGNLAPGLHTLRETVTVAGDTVSSRRAFVLAVDPSLRNRLEEIRVQLALAWMDPEVSRDELSEYVLYVAQEVTRQEKGGK